MLEKNGIRFINKLMQEITNDDRPFGGKVFVVGGDFRNGWSVVLKRADNGEISHNSH